MKQSQLQHILDIYALGEVETFFKNKVWFINDVYTINNSYILKGYTSEDPFALEKEAYCYVAFKEHLPVPELIAADSSKRMYSHKFLLASKLSGQNLYSVWHLLNNQERRAIIKQLCSFLKKINQLPYYEFMEKFPSPYDWSWANQLVSKIQVLLSFCQKKGIIPETLAKNIQAFITSNKESLNEQKIWLVHRDIHFDNILVENIQITGMIDFEKIIVGSLDFVLSMVRRMSLFPTKYMSEADEPHAKKEDYENLLQRFEEYYPELFDFKDLAIRLMFYDLEYDLRLLKHHPQEQWIILNLQHTLGAF